MNKVQVNIEYMRKQAQSRRNIRQQYLSRLSQYHKNKQIYQEFFRSQGKEIVSQQTNNSCQIVLPKSQTQKNSPKQQKQLAQQNHSLHKKLSELQSQNINYLSKFKQKIQSLKQLYMNRIKDISIEGQTYKKQYSGRIEKVNQQIQKGEERIQELQVANTELQIQIDQAGKLSAACLCQIQEEYRAKLAEFEEVFAKSQAKINEMNDIQHIQELVQATLSNQQLIQQIKCNAESSEQQVQKLQQDYLQLLETKKQIIDQMKLNIQNKQKQVKSFNAFEKKLKSVIDKLSNEKQIYMAQNKQLSEELGLIGQLLGKILGKTTQADA